MRHTCTLPRHLQRQRRAGFTLVEIMLVIALIGLVVGVVTFNADAIFGQSSEKMAKIAVTQSFRATLMAYRANHGHYPEKIDDILPLLDNAESLKDPWNNLYQYRYPGKRNASGYDLWSMGPDGRTDTADDIGNW